MLYPAQALSIRLCCSCRVNHRPAEMGKTLLFDLVHSITATIADTTED